jgi:hypothetical protein
VIVSFEAVRRTLRFLRLFTLQSPALLWSNRVYVTMPYTLCSVPYARSSPVTGSYCKIWIFVRAERGANRLRAGGLRGTAHW